MADSLQVACLTFPVHPWSADDMHRSAAWRRPPLVGHTATSSRVTYCMALRSPLSSFWTSLHWILGFSLSPSSGWTLQRLPSKPSCAASSGLFGSLDHSTSRSCILHMSWAALPSLLMTCCKPHCRLGSGLDQSCWTVLARLAWGRTELAYLRREDKFEDTWIQGSSKELLCQWSPTLPPGKWLMTTGAGCLEGTKVVTGRKALRKQWSDASNVVAGPLRTWPPLSGTTDTQAGGDPRAQGRHSPRRDDMAVFG